ncbi:MAG: hypothetical protein ACO32Y_09695 [Vulcanococcus sp.]
MHVCAIATRLQWFETLRVSIAQEHGKGWIVREVGATKRTPIGRCQLTPLREDRTRSSVVLPLEWKAARFLTYAVDECGAPTRFYPPGKAKLNELIGSAETTANKRLVPPIKPEDPAALTRAPAEQPSDRVKDPAPAANATWRRRAGGRRRAGDWWPGAAVCAGNAPRIQRTAHQMWCLFWRLERAPRLAHPLAGQQQRAT